jgi:hypothetical protein
MIEDHEFWDNLTEPKTPNDYEVSVYKKYIKGNALLLGETKKLRMIVNKGLDLFPTDFAEKGDWFDLKEHYDTIIGDGVLNFEHGLNLLEYLKPYCDRFICRVFTPEIQEIFTGKYAKNFYDDFPGCSIINKTQKGCCIVVYDFNKTK